MLARRMDRPARRRPFIDQLTQDLQLTPQQRSQIQGIFADAHKRFNAVFQQSQDQARPQYDAIRKDVHARIRAILTPAQQAKFDALLKRLGPPRGPHGPPGGRRGRGRGRGR
jgi:Spy/CpxP family protein refolding chaperone